MKGALEILNVGEGDTKVVFDPKSPGEIARAKRVIDDMLKRGFAILVQVGEQDGEPIYRRAKAFDAATCEYIVAGVPYEENAREDAVEEAREEAAAEEPAAPKPKLKRGRKSEHRVKASETRAVAVARSAGG